jgi:putative SOS response-associated peptidase YedK
MEWDELLSYYGLAAMEEPERWRGPRFNVAPCQSVPVIVNDPEAGGWRPVMMRWGFPPMWLAKQGKEPFNEKPLINAKSETALEKPTWRRALRQRRCLVPTTGFYEWIKVAGERYPLHLRPPDEGILTLAGVWDRFDWGERKGWPCMSILTTEPNQVVAEVHNRMPVLLAEEAWRRWTDPATDLDEITSLLAPAPNEALALTEANTALNAWSVEGPELMAADWSRLA